MAKKKAVTGRARRRDAGTSDARGFEAMALHVTEQHGCRAFEALKADRRTVSTFAIEASLPKNLDPESAAKRILDHAFASAALPSLTAPKVDTVESEFRSLGV